MLLLGLAACQQTTFSPTEQPSSTLQPPTASYEHLCVVFQLEVPIEVRRGETADFTMTAKNTCDQAVELGVAGVKPYGIILAQQDGVVVWTWPPPDGDSGDILFIETLGPQGELVYTQDWSVEDNNEKPVASGTYQVYGVLRLVVGEQEENRQLVSEVETFSVGP